MSLFAALFILGCQSLAPAEAYVPADASTVAIGPALVILDPGHGGADYGAVSHGVVEKNLALSFARRIQADLERQGIQARLTRDRDENLPLDQRIAESERWDRAVFVSLHANQVWHRPKVHGIIVYSYGTKVIAQRKPGLHLPRLPPPNPELERQSVRLGEMVARSLKQHGLKAREIQSDYYVLKNPVHPSVLVELGFLTNSRERRRLTNSRYQRELSGIIAKDLASYLRGYNAETLTASR